MPVARVGIKRTLNLVEAAASLAAVVRRECESLVATAFQSEDIKEAQLTFMEKGKDTSSAASARQSPLSRCDPHKRNHSFGRQVMRAFASPPRAAWRRPAGRWLGPENDTRPLRTT